MSNDPEKPASSAARPGGAWWRWGLALLAAATVVAALRLLPVKEYLRAVLDWAHGLGAWGPVAVAAIYLPACVLFLPGSVLTLGAGALFGLVPATIAVSIGSTLGATAAFLLGRTVARKFIERKVAGRPAFAAVDAAVGREGFKIVLLTRLSPLFPFNFLNYAYGLTKVRLRDYVLASWIGMLPGTVMYVYIGSAIGSVTQAVAGGARTRTAAEWALYAVGLLATVAVTVYVTRLARRALRQAVPPSAAPATPRKGESHG